MHGTNAVAQARVGDWKNDPMKAWIGQYCEVDMTESRTVVLRICLGWVTKRKRQIQK